MKETYFAVSNEFSHWLAYRRCAFTTSAHNAVVILIALGVHIKAISELLGHISVAFTFEVYGHLLEETRREAAAKTDEALNPIQSGVATKSISDKIN